jgi:AcrR family transcriptional regulator
MTPRVSDPDRAAETEAAIVEAARHLLAEGGLDALSMRAVASRVGISATAIYNYFENKQALIDRVVTQAFERFGAYQRQAIAELPAGSIERVRALGRAYIGFALENQEYFKVIFALRAERPRDIDELPGGGGYHAFRQAVVEAMESGEMRQADPDLVVLYLWTHVHGLVTLFLACAPDARCEHTGEPLEIGDLFSRFVDFIHNGLAPVASPAPTGSALAS